MRKQAKKIDVLRARYERDPSYQTGSDLGIALVLNGHHDQAQVLFQKMTEDDADSDDSFIWLGAVFWLLGNSPSAVGTWLAGLTCKYTDGGGGMHIPLLLYFAAIRDQRAFDKKKAIALIKQRAASDWADNWPGPIGRFLAGAVSEKQLLEIAAQESDPNLPLEVAQAHFYLGVRALEDRQKSVFSCEMNKCAEQKDVEEIPEFHIAVQIVTGE
jgi:lipoprotein NlpI